MRSRHPFHFGHAPARRAALAAATLACGCGLLANIIGAPPAAAQTLNDKLQARQPAGAQKDKMLVEAKELIYNKDNDTVAANGDVQIYYQGKILEADKVTYDRNSHRVYAEGNAKLTEPDGTVTYGKRFELTDDFRDGFIDSLTTETKDKTRFSSPRGERTSGETTVLDKATYTACAACADHPERPPLWQVRATKIIHKNQEQTVYYENAYLEFLGYPVAWVPFLSTPDPSVTRRSGVLAPTYLYRSTLGYGVGVPYFWALAPNYDVTVTPTVLSRQGVLGDVEWRHRLLNGSYSIRASGIFQADPAAFAPAPYDAGNKEFRGVVQSAGKFYLSDKWSFGWDTAFWSDKFFRDDYKIKSDTLTTDYFRESISTAYLRGQGDRGFFDLRGYYFTTLSPYDLQKQQPVVLPVWDYNKAFTLPKSLTYGIGGELTFDYNLTSLSRDLASYQSVGTRLLDPVYGLYDVCSSYVRGKCLLRGIGGDYDRVSAQLSWRRNFIDPVGGVWQPFAFARVDGTWSSINSTRGDLLSSGPTSATISNAAQSNFVGPKNDDFSGRAMPGIGVEYRFPLVASTSWATHVFEPIAQVIVRPDETRHSINEDAQSLVFDDTNIFEWNKYSGYDRVEGGTRLNAGAQYTMKFNSGGYVNALAGQSFQLAGRNSYAVADDANTGLDSGLENRESYYITRLAIAPTPNYSFITKANFDNNNFDLKRLDISANANFGHLTTSVIYARYAAQPEIGFDKLREGLALSGKYDMFEHYFVSGSVAFDLSRHLYDAELGTKTSRFAVASSNIGIGYHDECTTFSLNYTSGYGYGNSAASRGDAVVLQLTLRSLGSARVTEAVDSQSVVDGIGSTKVGD
jgi:LPS-assembly protein